MKRITRSADGNLVQVATPAFLSLVGKPANQRPFPVIRSADAAPTIVNGRVARTKRGSDAVLMLTFPDGYTEEMVIAVLLDFGMDGYTILVEGDMCCAVRSDLQSIAKVTEMAAPQIRLTSDGVVASVDPAQYQPKQAARSAALGLVAIEFDKKTFDDEKIISWSQQNNVDIGNDGIENSSGDVATVKRGDISKETDVRRMQVEDGVVFVLKRDCCDADGNGADGIMAIPAGFVAIVNEAAYGNWGWGQIDFAAANADIAFCNSVSDAGYRMSDVMYQILFYSELPLDTRKQLVTRCLQQYGAFINDAIDSLPRQVLLLASRADVSKNQSLTREDDTMKIDAVAAQKELDAILAKRAAENTPAAVAAAAVAAVEAAPAVAAAAPAEVARTDVAAPAAAVAAAPAVQAAAGAEAPITRAEMATMIATAVAAAMAPAAAAAVVTEAVRADAAAAPAAVAAAPAVAAEAPITRADMAAIMADLIKPVAEQVTRLEGVTVVRSEGVPVTTAAKVDATKENVFRGAFGDIAGRKE